MSAKFHTWSKNWTASPASAEATHVHGVQISLDFLLRVDSDEVVDFSSEESQTPFLSYDWEPMLKALARLPELRRIILNICGALPYDDLVKFAEVLRHNLREDISVELVHYAANYDHWRVVDLDTLQPGTFSPWFCCCCRVSDGFVSSSWGSFEFRRYRGASW